MIKMNKKGSGLFDGVIIGFLVFTFVMIAGAVIIEDWQTNYADIAPLNNSLDEFDDTYNTLANISDMTDEMKGKTDGDVDEEGSTGGSISSMSIGAYSAIRLIPRTWDLFNAITSNIGATIGFTCQNDKYDSDNCWVIDIFMYMFIITIVFGTIYWIRGFKVRG